MHKAYASISILLLLAVLLTACGASTKTVDASLGIGQTKVFDIGGKDYEITLLSVSSAGGVFNINGEITPPLKNGQTFTASDGFKFTVSGLTNAGATLSFDVPVGEASTPTVEIQGKTYDVTLAFCASTTVVDGSACGTDPCKALWGTPSYSLCYDGSQYKEFRSCVGDIGSEADKFEGSCRQPASDVYVCDNKALAECRELTNTPPSDDQQSPNTSRLVLIGALLIVAAGIVYVSTRRRK